MNWDDGDEYEGFWVDGKKEGFGRYKKKTGRKFEYEGNYVKNEKSGFGKIVYEDGETYEGNWMLGNREG